jgi:UDP-glucose 4-epimerase
VREVIDTAGAATGHKFDACDVERRAGDSSILVADATRALELLGWSAERSDLATIIADAWHWHKRRFDR